MWWSIIAWVPGPRVVVVVVGRWHRLLLRVRRPWLEGVIDVVLDQTTVLECVLDGDLVVGARCIQELLEMVLCRTSLRQVSLGPCCLALDCHDEVVVTLPLVSLLLLLEARGSPFTVVHDLFPLALGCVKGCRHRLFAIRVVARNVEEFPSSSGCAAPESVDEGGASHTVLEHQDGVIVRHTGKLDAALGETPDVLVQALP
jgi:hypothetical protein